MHVEMRGLFIACVLIAILSTLLLFATEQDVMDRVALGICAIIQFGLLSSCVSGSIAHIVFIIAISYGSLFAERSFLMLTSALIVLTLALRIAYGGCLFNLVEGDNTLRARTNWVADTQILSLLIVALFRLCVWTYQLSVPQRMMGVACLMLYVTCTWKAEAPARNGTASASVI